MKNRGNIVVATLGLVVIAALVFGLVGIFDEGGKTQSGVASWYGPGFHGK